MSGLEVTGLILGAYPLVLDALDTYRDAWRKLAEWWDFQRTFEDFIDDVGIQRLIFEDNLEKLLAPFVESDRQMGSLLSDAYGNEWRNPRLEAGLKERLGRSYPMYMSLVKKINETLDDLGNLLGLHNGKSLQMYESRTAKEWKTELKRIRLVFSQHKITQLTSLTKLNSELRKLLKASDELAPLRRQRKSTSLASFLQAVHDQASSLHAALDRSWSCECVTPHRTKLCLEPRTDYAKAKDVKLKLLFPTDRESFQETEIKIIEEPPPYKESPSPAGNEKAAPATSAESILELKRKIESHKASKKSLLKPASKIPTSSNGRPNLLSPPKSPQPTSALPVRSIKKVGFTEAKSPEVPSYESAMSSPEDPQTRIEDLCSTFSNIKTDKAVQSSRNTTKCIGYLLDKHHRRHGVFSTSNIHTFVPLQPNPPKAMICANETPPAISLADILAQNSTSPIKLTRRARYTIALTIASSVLQLYSTPWMTSSLDKSHILFSIPSTSSSATAGTSIPEPYISTSFHSIHSKPPTPDPSPSQTLSKASVAQAPISQTRTTLLSLATLLLELLFAVPLEQKAAEYLPPATSYPETPLPYITHLILLESWLSEVADEIGPEMQEALSLCVHCGVGRNVDLGVKDGGFVGGLWEGLVVNGLGKLVGVWEGGL